MNVTALDIAMRFIGTKEVPGTGDNPAIMAMLGLHNDWPENDETPWCSAFVAYCCWLLGLPHSKSLLARSWLHVGTPLGGAGFCRPGFDVVIFNRQKLGARLAPGPEDVTAPGHVAFFYQYISHAGTSAAAEIFVCGGNQGDAVSIQPYPESRVLGYRRLYGSVENPTPFGLAR